MIRSTDVLSSWLLLAGAAAQAAVYPGTTWEFQSPSETGLDAARLDELRDYVGGRGCVVRHGYMVYTWGDQTVRQDVASACKPWFSHFLFKAVEDGRLASLDDLVVNWEPCLFNLNAALGYKDRGIAFRHMANQISCYGVREAPGTAFDYNDWQMALFWDTLFLKVYGATYNNVDSTVLHPMLTDVMQCEDNPTLLAFGPADRPGRVRISVRDFARFGLLYLRQGNWAGTQLVSPAHAVMAVTSPVSNAIPRTAGAAADMCAGQRSIGSTNVPDNQTEHKGSYSWLWWINGVDGNGQRYWPDVPTDAFGAFGHANGQRAVAVIPSLDLVVSWNDTTLGGKPDNPNQALKRLVAAVLPDRPLIRLDPGALDRTVDYGENPTDDTFTVTNGGTDTLVYAVETDPVWLSAGPDAGASSGESDTITVSYDTAGLAVGTHEATITIRDDGSVPPAGNSPQMIPVTLRVKSVKPDFDRDGDVDVSDFGHLQVCLTDAAVPNPPTCLDTDLNRDGLVSQGDVQVFLDCLSAPGLVAEKTCDDAYE